jgi:propanediol dehydratase large subunit
VFRSSIAFLLWTDCVFGQGYDLEMRIDNMQMDIMGVELSVANAHQQIQHVEDEVCETLSNRIRGDYLDLSSTIEAVENKFNDRCD